ncbi:sensor histidine kinase [Nocardia stercoris]|uniref:histidine kinase n=1 Tax=Nocardia stercoris TaxID=2483361 RepID=A0A3M2L8E0_9NOCA|nr:nitrate- and nitrite sensing domain-containing protein [Nocardia stercoris]RMI33664.1 HAMP domain-containing protein [Nocardia stercoris]
MSKPWLGLRTRIVAIALVPSISLVTLGGVGTAYLVYRARDAKDFQNALSAGSGPTAAILAAVERERMASMWSLAGEPPDQTALPGARAQVDSATVAVMKMVDDFHKLPGYSLPAETPNSNAQTAATKAALDKLRMAIDAQMIPPTDTDAAFTQMLGSMTVALQVMAKVAPTGSIALDLGGALVTLQALEGLTRSGGWAAVALDGPGLTPEQATIYRNLVGSYHSTLQELATGDPKSETVKRAQAMLADPALQRISALEDYIIRPPEPAKPGGAVPAAPMTLNAYRGDVEKLAMDMLQLWTLQQKQAADEAIALTDHQNANAEKAVGLAFGASVLVFLVSLYLADRLARRLKRLRSETIALADERLPDLLGRLGAGEQIDPTEIEAGHLDFGSDEIGSVAAAFNQAFNAAVKGAVTEARTREGVQAVFLNLAHRSQLVVHRQLEILDEAEARQEDPQLLEMLFRLDHLATRERRNAENLTILGGGRPGRQWRRPVPLVELVRSAVGETLDYAQVRTGRMPQLFVVGAVVTDLVHLLAELVDNATAFSPPDSRVDVNANVVGRGLVIEISDQGVGMEPEDRERRNELLRNPPPIGVASLTADSRLGLFVVAQLGSQHGISVRLTESDYGGIKAIVLIPTSLVVSEAADADHLRDRTAIGRPELDRAPAHAAEPAALPIITAEIVTGATETESTVAVAPPAPISYPEPTPAPQQAPIAEPASFQQPTSYPQQAPFAEPDPYPSQPQFRPQAPLRESYEAPATPGPVDVPGRPPLPRRRRQASISPELTHRPADGPAVQRPRSADQARDLMSAIENGTRQGRRAVPDETVTTTAHRFRAQEQEGSGDF